MKSECDTALSAATEETTKQLELVAQVLCSRTTLEFDSCSIKCDERILVERIMVERIMVERILVVGHGCSKRTNSSTGSIDQCCPSILI